MKVIFLDIDGVLNSDQLCDEWHAKTGKGGYGGFFEEDDPATDENVKWGRNMIDALRHIVKSTGAQIVISSTWRKSFSLNKFLEMFRVYDWDAPVIDKTPNTRLKRGWEISMWLEKNKYVTDYVILDDLQDFYPNQQKRFVQTDPDIGLTFEDAEKAIKILNHGVQSVSG